MIKATKSEIKSGLCPRAVEPQLIVCVLFICFIYFSNRNMCIAVEWDMFLRIKQDSVNVVIAVWLSAKIK